MNGVMEWWIDGLMGESMRKDVLILGVGNVLLSDEGVGVHVAQRLQKMALPSNIEVVDGGTAGFELIEFFFGKKKIIIVDAVQTDDEAGSIFRFVPEEAALRWAKPYSSHQTGVRELLHFAQHLEPLPQIVVYGIVPTAFDCLSTNLSEILEDRLPLLIHRIINEAVEEPAIEATR